MIPLCTTKKSFSSSLVCGCEFFGAGGPCVAHLVCAMPQLQSLAAQQGDGMSHINQINQMNQMAWMAQQNLAYQMASQNYAATPVSPQQNANFCRPTAIYAAKSIDDNVGEQRNAASGGA